ncbi:MAG: LON peptidase substrate-binding domain-containing protein [Alphaproteobacteria bacterium]
MKRYRNIAELPSVIPVFPLADVLLLPRAHLPLNIFEPRYLAMVDAVMSGKRIIGMIQPREAAPGDPAPALVDAGSLALVDVGCAGRITAYSETDDGRYLITLTGVARFRVAEERDAQTPFRQIVADYAPFASDLVALSKEPEIARNRLMNALKPYLAVRNLQTDWQTVMDAPAELLVNALATMCPFAPEEKQALLEAPSVPERAEMIIALIEMANAAARHPPSGGRVN